MKKTWLFLKLYNSIFFVPLMLVLFTLILFSSIDLNSIRLVVMGEVSVMFIIYLWHFILFVNIVILFLAMIFHWVDYHKISKVSKDHIGVLVLIDVDKPKDYERIKEMYYEAFLSIFIGNIEKANYEMIFPTHLRMKKQLSFLKDPRAGKKKLKEKNIAMMVVVSSEDPENMHEDSELRYIINDEYRHEIEDEKIAYLSNKLSKKEYNYSFDTITINNKDIKDGFRFVLSTLLLKLNYLSNSQELIDDMVLETEFQGDVKREIKSKFFRMHYMFMMYDYYWYLDYKEEEMLVDMRERLESLQEIQSNNYIHDMYYVIYRLLLGDDADSLLILINEKKKNHEYIKEFIFLEGFIELMNGKISTGYKIMKKATMKGISSRRITYLEALAKGLMLQKNDMIHLNLALAVLNEDVRLRADIAEVYYEAFMKTTKYKIDETVEMDVLKKISYKYSSGSA